MQKAEQCEVYSRKKDIYYVKLVKNAECEGCKACAFGRKNYLIIPALSNIECSAGDKVVVKPAQRRVKGSYVFLYLLPLLFVFAGLMIPFGHGEAWMLLGGGIGLIVSIPVVYFIERLFRRSKKYLPVITEKISETKENTDD